jgi:hypothetical protein
MLAQHPPKAQVQLTDEVPILRTRAQVFSKAPFRRPDQTSRQAFCLLRFHRLDDARQAPCQKRAGIGPAPLRVDNLLRRFEKQSWIGGGDAGGRGLRWRREWQRCEAPEAFRLAILPGRARKARMPFGWRGTRRNSLLEARKLYTSRALSRR